MRVRLWRVCGFALLFGALLLVERRRPLRRRVEPQADRLTRNASAGLLSALVVNRLEAALVTPLARTADRRRLGLLGRAVLPRPLRALVGFLLLDYTLYLWHVLNHRTAALWRFHLVHHVDLDLDVSTGIRFHFGEMALGSLFRVLQVLALGVDVPTLRVWEVTLLGSVLFHHSNLELPIDRERELSRVLVTPRMHGIHHSIVRRETDSNFSSLLAWWDWLHGTARVNVPQQSVTVGVPAYQDPGEVTLPKILRLPFVPQRGDWLLPDGREPDRVAVTMPSGTLAS